MQGTLIKKSRGAWIATSLVVRNGDVAHTESNIFRRSSHIALPLISQTAIELNIFDYIGGDWMRCNAMRSRLTSASMMMLQRKME